MKQQDESDKKNKKHSKKLGSNGHLKLLWCEWYKMEIQVERILGYSLYNKCFVVYVI